MSTRNDKLTTKDALPAPQHSHRLAHHIKSRGIELTLPGGFVDRLPEISQWGHRLPAVTLTLDSRGRSPTVLAAATLCMHSEHAPEHQDWPEYFRPGRSQRVFLAVILHPSLSLSISSVPIDGGRGKDMASPNSPPPEYLAEETCGPGLIAASVIMAIIGTVFVALRFYTRACIVHKLGLSDWTILIALIFSIGNSAGSIRRTHTSSFSLHLT